jgi:hypothetical protein
VRSIVRVAFAIAPRTGLLPSSGSMKSVYRLGEPSGSCPVACGKIPPRSCRMLLPGRC